MINPKYLEICEIIQSDTGLLTRIEYHPVGTFDRRVTQSHGASYMHIRSDYEKLELHRLAREANKHD
jgi:hypothetical protein